MGGGGGLGYGVGGNAHLAHRLHLPSSSHTYVKLDWLSWAANLATDDADFHSLMDPIFTEANVTTSRVPLTDLFDTGELGAGLWRVRVLNGCYPSLFQWMPRLPSRPALLRVQ